MTLPRYDKKRRLERAGFTFLSGWVRNEDAPPIRRAFERGEDEAERALKEASTAP
jgi:hypothetical protein